MLYLSSLLTYNEDNEFELKELYVSDNKITYVLRKEEQYLPVKYHVSLLDVHRAVQALPFSGAKYSNLRQYNDDDAHSLAKYLQNKITSVNMNLPGADQTLADALAIFGDALGSEQYGSY